MNAIPPKPPTPAPFRSIGKVSADLAETVLERMLSRQPTAAARKQIVMDLKCWNVIDAETATFLFYRFGLNNA